MASDLRQMSGTPMRARGAFVLAALLGLGGCTAVDEAMDDHSVRAPESQPGYRIAVQPGDTLDGVASHYDVDRYALIRINHLRPPYQLQPYQTLVIPPPATYRVRAGDSVAGIATTLGVDEAALARANGLSQPYHMRIGQVLKVPGGVGDEGDVSAPAGPLPPSGSEQLFNGVAPPPRSSITVQPLTPPPGQTSGPQPQFTPPPASSPPPNASPYPPPPSSSSPTALAPPSSRPNQTQAAQAQASQAPVAPRPAKPPETASAAPETIVPPPPQTATQPAAIPPPAQRESAVREPAPPQVAAAETPAGAPHFIKPVAGKVISNFGDKTGAEAANNGIDIAATSGTPVRAAEGGIVAYAGNELQTFGNLVLIRHAGGWVTAYTHMASISVKLKDSVTQGQVIGTVGQTGTASQPELHFEIRQGIKPVDPAPLLGGKG